VEDVFGLKLLGRTAPNPESPGGFISIVTGEGVPIRSPAPSLVQFETPCQTQEMFTLRIWKAGVQAEPLNTRAPDFLAKYVPGGLLYIIWRMLQSGEGTQLVHVAILLQR
jgi:hypothetical protein